MNIQVATSLKRVHPPGHLPMAKPLDLRLCGLACVIPWTDMPFESRLHFTCASYTNLRRELNPRVPVAGTLFTIPHDPLSSARNQSNHPYHPRIKSGGRTLWERLSGTSPGTRLVRSLPSRQAGTWGFNKWNRASGIFSFVIVHV